MDQEADNYSASSEIPSFVGHKVSLLSSQEHSTGPSPEPDKPIPHSYTLFP